MEREQWEPIADRIAAAWPGVEFGPERREVYFAVLEGLPAPAVAAAVEDAIRSAREAPPAPGVLAQAARANMPSKDPAPAPAPVPEDPARRRRRRIWVFGAVGGAVAVVVGVGLWWYLAVYGVEHYYIPTPTMEPTIEAGSNVAVDTRAYGEGEVPDRGDIILFDPTDSANRTCGEPAGGPSPMIKRVVGIPGDRVEARDGQLFINGAPEAAPEGASAPEYDKRRPQVPDGHVLVLGDNRNESCDSHQWYPDPFLPVELVRGKAKP